MRRATVFLIFTLALMSRSAYADYGYKFVRFLCVTELGVLAIDTIDVDASRTVQDFVEMLDNKGLNENNLVQLRQRHGLFVEGPIAYSCKLGGRNFSIDLIFTEPSDRGMCGAGTRGSMTVRVDGKPLLDKIRFSEDCFGDGVVGLLIDDGGSVNWKFHRGKSVADEGTRIHSNSILVDLASGTYIDYKSIRVALPITMREIAEYPILANPALQPAR